MNCRMFQQCRLHRVQPPGSSSLGSELGPWRRVQRFPVQPGEESALPGVAGAGSWE